MNIPCFFGVCALLLWHLVCGSGACNVTLYAEREPLNFTSPNYLTAIESDHTSANVHRICGSNRWTIIVDDDQHFHVVFKTDNSVTKSGFLIRYYESKERALCGVHLVATSVGKTFTSPGYPNSYFLLQSCTWNITTEHPNQTVILYTTDSELGDYCTRRACGRDYVTVYNGQNSSDTLGRFCDDEKPVFVSGGNSLRVHLHTDSTTNYRGFRMLYKSVPATTCNVTMPAGKRPIQIVSPGYPNNYQSGLDCQWTINAPSGNSIRIEVLFVDMETAPSCAKDYLLFNDGSSASAGQTKICNITSSPIVSSSNHMTIMFHSDSTVTGKGFRLQYSKDNPCSNCPSYLTASLYTERYLTSPGYPSSNNSMHCTWTISASIGYNIKVEIVVLSIDASCTSNYLLFSDGSSPNVAQLGRYCGSNHRYATVVSSGNHMTVTFHTNSPNRGFKLKYKAGYVLTTTETPSDRNCSSSWLSASTSVWQHLTSPGTRATMLMINSMTTDLRNWDMMTCVSKPDHLFHNLHCRWTIFAPIGRKVVVEIVDLSIEHAVSCASDYLLISDGSSSYPAQLGKYCGYTIGNVFSSSNYITLTFHTDSSVTRKGFTLKYKSTTSGCGQDLQLSGSETKYIESPNYPFNYPANTDCAWKISTGVDGPSIDVKVVNFNLPYDTSCSRDYVILKEGNVPTGKGSSFIHSVLIDGTHEYWLGRWCGSNGPETDTVGSTLKVLFHADGSRSSSGFKLSVTADHPTSEPYKRNIGAIIGGVFAGIVVLVVVMCCCCGVCSMKKSTTNDQQRDRSGDNSVYSIPLSNRQGPAGVFTPPPAYSEVVKDDPPPYCQIAQLSDVQPIVAPSPSGASGIDNPASVYRQFPTITGNTN